VRAVTIVTGTTRVVQSLTAIVSGKILLTLGSLLLVPLYLTHWSPTVYGEWLALSAAVAYLSALDLGMNMGAVNRLTQAYARGDAAEYTAVQRAGLAFYGWVALTGTVGLAAVVAIAPIRERLGLVELTQWEVAFTVWILGCLILWAMPSGFILATYRSRGDLATSQWIGNASQIFVIAATAIALGLGGRPTVIALVQLVPLVVVTALVMRHLWSRHPSLAPSFGSWPEGMLTSLLRPSLLFVLVIVANAMTLQGSVIVVSVALGGGAVALFVTLRTLANVIRQVVNTLVIAVWPEITRLDVLGERAVLRSAHSLVVAVTSSVCVAFGAALWWEGAEVISVWTRGMLTADVTTLRLLLVLLVLQSPWIVGFVFVAASGRHARASIASLTSSVVGLVLAMLLVHRFGTAGVVGGLIVGDVVACAHFVVRDACDLVGEAYAPFALRLWSCLVIVSTAALFLGWAAHVAVGGHFAFRWLVVGLATSLATGAATWALWLTSDDRELLSRRFRPATARMASAKA